MDEKLKTKNIISNLQNHIIKINNNNFDNEKHIFEIKKNIFYIFIFLVIVLVLVLIIFFFIFIIQFN